MRLRKDTQVCELARVCEVAGVSELMWGVSLSACELAQVCELAWGVIFMSV